MGIWPTEHTIVRRWIDTNAPTGEGEMYQTEDGRVWQRTFYARGAPTGESRGRLRQGRIEEQR